MEPCINVLEKWKDFTIFKFRAMVVDAYEMGGVVTSSDDSRITKVGSFL